MISIVNGVLIRIVDSRSWAVEIKPVCPYCGNAESSSWNHVHGFAPTPNSYGYKKTSNHMCSKCRKSFKIELYNN